MKKFQFSVAAWMYTGVIMLLIQFILGGITRLTGSGLSITEWNLVTGVLPPLNHEQWMAEFAKYQHTPQYRLLNSDFTLSDFKFIFFWEWSHRLWARLVGVVFLVGFVYFLVKRKMDASMVRPMIVLFLLGALQGAVGWVMVASGLTGDAIYVVPTKLALHFVFACGLIVYTFWFALQLSVDVSKAGVSRAYGGAGVDVGAGGSLSASADRSIHTGVGGSLSARAGRSVDTGAGVRAGRSSGVGRLRGWTVAILIVLFFQLLYGALMAGHKAATVAPTWPTINGSYMPSSVFTQRPLSTDLVGNTLTVHFLHRSMAYLLIFMILVWTVLAGRVAAAGGYLQKVRWLPLLIAGLQVLLGIFSLLTSPGIVPNRWVGFNWLAQFHQITGLLLLLTITGMLYLVRAPRRR